MASVVAAVTASVSRNKAAISASCRFLAARSCSSCRRSRFRRCLYRASLYSLNILSFCLYIKYNKTISNFNLSMLTCWPSQKMTSPERHMVDSHFQKTDRLCACTIAPTERVVETTMIRVEPIRVEPNL